jgi:hypothetical protein
MYVGSSGPQFVWEGTLTFSSVNNGATAEQTISLPNSKKFPINSKKSVMILRLPDAQAGLTFSNPFITSSTQFKVRITNTTGGALTPTGTNAMIVVL